ncbi:MAG: ATP-binding protein [Chloroflexi bacterium]|nr:ATP-binding protein [Chloroflexota bacterium]
MLDKKRYEQVVLRSAFNKVIDIVLEQGKDVGSVKPNPTGTVVKKRGYSTVVDGEISKEFVLIGTNDEHDDDCGILGWTGNKKVLLDMFVGRKQQVERAHTMSVFGVQKSGKSYTLGAILEMALAPQQGVRKGPPLPAVIFHYDKNTAYRPEFVNMVYPASSIGPELAKLEVQPTGVSDIVVLVPPWRLKERKAEFPGANVQPLVFSPREMGQPEWLLLMGVPGSETLYVNQIKSLLLQLNVAGEITLQLVQKAVMDSSMSSQAQKLALQRLELARHWIQEGTGLLSWLKPGRLVILDIRDEMIDANDAIRLCLISLGLLQRVQTSEGFPFPKLVVLDEAHKYVQKEFASEIVTLVNQMRHTATTVVIASQNPDSIPSDVIEKSSIVILHKLTSPNQTSYLRKSVQGLATVDADQVAGLQNGEAIVWASESTDSNVTKTGIKIKIRPRYTRHI